MSETNGNGGVTMKWAHLIFALLMQVIVTVGGLGAVYGTLKFQVEDHARRLDAIEKKQEDNYISRSEYDKRHTDLQEQMKEIREQIRELERKTK